MAVKLRLTRVGKTKQPQYRIVAADSRSPRDGRFIEIVGHYNPRSEPSTISAASSVGAPLVTMSAPRLPSSLEYVLIVSSGCAEIWGHSLLCGGGYGQSGASAVPHGRRSLLASRPLVAEPAARAARAVETSCGGSSS